MRNVLAIAGKECRVYLTTWTSYVLLAAFVEVTGLIFYFLVRDYQLMRLRYAEMRAVGMLEQMNLTDLVVGPLFSYAASMLVLMLPILTMRLIAEERGQKTLELLMTSPVHPLEIVLGKYCAALCVLMGMLAATLVFPLALHIYAGDTDPNAIDWRTVGTAYLGLGLLGAAGTALSLWASSMTDSQIVAVVSASMTLLVLTLIGFAAPGQEGIWNTLLNYASLTNHLIPFARGLVRSTDVTYYLSLIVLGLFLAYRFVEAERWS